MNRLRRLSRQKKVLLAVAVVLAVLCLLELIFSAQWEKPKTTADLKRETETQAESAAQTEPAPPETQQTEPAETAPETDETLRAALDQALAGQPGTWCVYTERLDTGVQTAVGAAPEEPMVSASIIKLFIMGAVYEQMEQGTLVHDEVYEDLYDMITVSSNEAANDLTRQLGNGDAGAGMASVNLFAANLGCTGTAYNRLMLEDNGQQNYVTAADCARFLRMVYAGSCVSPAASAEMLEILKAQTGHDYIPAGVPADVVTAHKGGDLLGICQGDVGIVFADGAPYLVCILCNGPADYGDTMQTIAGLSRIIYEQMTGQ